MTNLSFQCAGSLSNWHHSDAFAGCMSVVPEAGIKAGTCNYIPQYLWPDVITCPCPWYLRPTQHPWIAARRHAPTHCYIVDCYKATGSDPLLLWTVTRRHALTHCYCGLFQDDMLQPIVISSWRSWKKHSHRRTTRMSSRGKNSPCASTSRKHVCRWVISNPDWNSGMTLERKRRHFEESFRHWLQRNLSKWQILLQPAGLIFFFFLFPFFLFYFLCCFISSSLFSLLLFFSILSLSLSVIACSID